MKKLELVTRPKPSACSILIGESFSNLGKHCEVEKIILVTDRNVIRAHREMLDGFRRIVIKSRESEKTSRTVNIVHRKLQEYGVDGSTMLLGVGGGIVTDIAGFVASTYHRGIPFAFAPTTLLAATDASIGGKNGVNLMGFKNQIGMIRQPRFCLIDFGFFDSLTETGIRCGIAEIVKHAAIADRNLFSYLEGNVDALLNLDPRVLEHTLHASIAVKLAIVQRDEMERGERMRLNFGHTFGHAIESTCGVPHGFAISIGMAIEAGLSSKMGKLPEKERLRLVSLLERFGLPTSAKVERENIFKAIGMDKKRLQE